MFAYSRGGDGIVDSETGETLRTTQSQWEADSYWLGIFDASGTQTFSIELARMAVDEHGDSGGATFVRYTVLGAWTFEQATSRATRVKGEHPNIERIEQFYRETAKTKNPSPRVEFVDGRKWSRP